MSDNTKTGLVAFIAAVLTLGQGWIIYKEHENATAISEARLQGELNGAMLERHGMLLREMKATGEMNKKDVRPMPSIKD